MKATYYGHSCFLLETAGKRILFDPFITPNPAAAHIRLEDIRPDYILVSHGHEDHVADLIELAKMSNALVVCSWEIYAWLGRNGISHAHPMNAGGTWTFDFGKVRMVQAAHSSSLPDGSYGGIATGFLLFSEGKTVYYSGDTDLFGDMKVIGERFSPGISFLPIGDNFTMGAADAALAANWLQCNTVVAMHFDTFPYIKIDHAEAKAAFDARNVTVHLPEIGQILHL